MIKIRDIIPTITFEPIDWSTQPHSDLLGTSKWPAFWRDELAQIGLKPAFPGSWQVPVSQLTSARTLEKLVMIHLNGLGIRGFPDEDGEEEGDDEEYVGSMPGGYCLVGTDGQVIVDPGCCCDLGDYKFWESCSALSPGETCEQPIGHAEFLVSRDEESLIIHYPAAQGNPAETFHVCPDSLSNALAPAREVALDFRARLEKVLEIILEPSQRAPAAADCLTGLNQC